MLLYRCEYLQIISSIDSKMPHFFDKYPGYKIFLSKLHYCNIIIQEKPKDEIYNFFNKELFPLLKKYNEGIGEDYFEFKDLIENPNILKSRTYQQIWEKSCKVFEAGLNLSLDWVLWIENETNNNSPKVISYYKEKENFIKEINIIINYEKEVIKCFKSNELNKSHNFPLYEFEQDLLNKNCEENEFDDVMEKPFNNFIFLPHELSENNEQLFSKNKSLNDDVNHVIFENKIDFINNNLYNDKINNFNIINNLKNNNLNLINNKNNNSNNINTNSIKLININNDSLSLNINTIGNKRNSKISINSKISNNSKISINSKGSTKSYKSDLRKKKIKEFKFKHLKRENVDKKILRKFKKFLKNKLKEKKDNEVKNYINNNEFWLEYIKVNLMPPFNYDKEKKSFKSFNTQYLCWFFEHKFALELFNIFTKNYYDDLLKLIINTYNLDEDTEDYLLLKTYINTMPLIYGKENQNRSTACSSNDNKPIDDELNNNQISIEEEEDKKNDNEICDKKFENMIIENDYIHDIDNINNINNINMNINNNILIDNMNNINKININNEFSNPQTVLYGDNSNMNLNSNLNENGFNNGNINDSFEENENRRFDPSLLKWI